MKNKSLFLLIAFVPLLITALVTRTIQLLIGIDFETGFYLRNTGFLPYALILVLIVTAVVIIVLTLWNKKIKSLPFTKSPSEFSRFKIKVLGFVFIVAGVDCFGVFIKAIPWGKGELARRLADPITIILNLVGGVLIVALGFTLYGSKKVGKLSSFLMTSLSVFLAIKASANLLGRMVIATKSQYLLEIFPWLFLIYFFLSATRLFLGKERKSTRVELIVTGLMASIISAVGFLPNLFLKELGPSNIKDMVTVGDFNGFLLGVAAFIIVLGFITGEKSKATPKEA